MPSQLKAYLFCLQRWIKVIPASYVSDFQQEAYKILLISFWAAVETKHLSVSQTCPFAEHTLQSISDR